MNEKDFYLEEIIDVNIFNKLEFDYYRTDQNVKNGLYFVQEISENSNIDTNLFRGIFITEENFDENIFIADNKFIFNYKDKKMIICQMNKIDKTSISNVKIQNSLNLGLVIGVGF